MAISPLPGPVVQRAILTSELQRLRQVSKATQEQVAAALDWSTSKVIRIEAGTVGVSTTDLHALLRYYGLGEDDPRVSRLTEIARDARQRGWWAPYKNELKPVYLKFIGYEMAASTIHSFDPLTIPGLLQTEEYAKAMSSEFVRSKDLCETIVEVRLQRQVEVLGRASPAQLNVVVDEAVLRRRVGGQVDPGIMHRQLGHLLDAVARPNISLAVIPFSKGAYFGLGGSFTLLEFARQNLEDVLYLERVGASDLLFVDRDPRVARYRSAFRNLRDLAVSAEESVAFVEEILDSMV